MVFLCFWANVAPLEDAVSGTYFLDNQIKLVINIMLISNLENIGANKVLDISIYKGQRGSTNVLLGVYISNSYF